MFDLFPQPGESEEQYIKRVQSLGFDIEKVGEGEYRGEMKSPMGVPKPADPRKQIDETRKERDCGGSQHEKQDGIMKKFSEARDQAAADYFNIGNGSQHEGQNDIPELERNAPNMARELKAIRASTASDAKITVKAAPPRSFVLDGAKEIVYGARQHMYGHASINFRRTADLWRGVFGQDVTNLQVGAALLHLKLARLGNLIEREASGGPAATFAEIEDTMKDIAGYAEATMRSLFETPDGRRTTE